MLADGTTNTLTDGTKYTDATDDEDMKAAFFSEGKMLFSGAGTLSVYANCKAGIRSDDYVIMKKMEERLPSQDFMRIHKSYIISLHHIAEVNKSRVILDNEKDIPIGDSYREKLNDYINQKFLGK